MKKIYFTILISLLSVCISYAQKPVAKFVVSKDTICQYDCVNFTDSSTNNPTSWLWIFHGGVDSISTVQNPQCIFYTDTGSYNVTLIATNANGSDTLNETGFIAVKQMPPPPDLIESHDTLFVFTDSAYVSYQWYIDSVPIPGATDTLYVMDSCANYSVLVTGKNGCSIAIGLNIILLRTEGGPCGAGIKTYSLSNLISISPNPAADHLNIHTSSFSSLVSNDGVTVSIMNVFGEIVQEEKQKWMNNISVNINALAAGIYFVEMKSENGMVVKKFVKE